MKRFFISYAHDDPALREAFATHLQVLCAVGIIAKWHDGEIAPGVDWNVTIDRELSAADIIIVRACDFTSCSIAGLAGASQPSPRGRIKMWHGSRLRDGPTLHGREFLSRSFIPDISVLTENVRIRCIGGD